MSQIKSGYVIVTNGSATIKGYGADWSQANVNNIFVVSGRSQSYLIVSEPAIVSDHWEATIERPYGEATATTTEEGYAIHKDFTPVLNLPIIASGDIETASIIARAFRILDSTATSGGGGSTGTPNSVTAVDTGTETLTVPNHGFVSGQTVLPTGTTLPGGVTAGQFYYAGVVDVDNIRLYTSQAGAVALGGTDLVNLTSAGSAVIISSYTPPSTSGTFQFTVSGSNDFVLGTAVCFTPTGYDKSSLEAGKRLVLGNVSNVNGSVNTVSISGRITGINPTYLTGASDGDIAYLKATSTAVNWQFSTSGLSTLIPLFQIESVSTGTIHIIPTAALTTSATMVGATPSVDGAAGSVPKPLAGEQLRYLAGDGTFHDIVVPNGSISYPQLVARSAPALAEYNEDLWTTGLSTARVSDLLFDLLMRTKRADLRQGGSAPVVLNFGVNPLAVNPATNYEQEWTVPANVKVVMVEIWGAGCAGMATTTLSNGVVLPPVGSLGTNSMGALRAFGGFCGTYVRFMLAVTPGHKFWLRSGYGHNQEVTDDLHSNNVGTYYPSTKAGWDSLASQLASYFRPSTPNGYNPRTYDGNSYLAYVEGGWSQGAASRMAPQYISSDFGSNPNPNFALLYKGDGSRVLNGASVLNTATRGFSGIIREIASQIRTTAVDGSVTVPQDIPIPTAYLDKLVYDNTLGLPLIIGPLDNQRALPIYEGGNAPFGGRGGLPLIGYDQDGNRWPRGLTPGGGAAPPCTADLSNGNTARVVPKAGHGLIRITY